MIWLRCQHSFYMIPKIIASVDFAYHVISSKKQAKKFIDLDHLRHREDLDSGQAC